MNSFKLMNQIGIELLLLAVFALLYIILRYIIFKRKIRYIEYEKSFYILVAFLILILFIFS